LHIQPNPSICQGAWPSPLPMGVAMILLGLPSRGRTRHPAVYLSADYPGAGSSRGVVDAFAGLGLARNGQGPSVPPLPAQRHADCEFPSAPKGGQDIIADLCVDRKGDRCTGDVRGFVSGAGGGTPRGVDETRKMEHPRCRKLRRSRVYRLPSRC
jgi:hypothetical protein